MILLILILCILPVALSLDAFEIAQETAGDYRLSAARRFLMSFCFSFFTFIIPVICSVLFRFFFRGLHILDILIPASFIDLLVPLAVLLFFTVTGGKKIIFGYIEYSGRSSPDPESDKKNEDVPSLYAGFCFLVRYVRSRSSLPSGRGQYFSHDRSEGHRDHVRLPVRRSGCRDHSIFNFSFQPGRKSSA